MKEIKVIGIDPAPSKPSVIYDGQNFIIKDAQEIKQYLKENENILICWDAPLTGPHECKSNVSNPFSKRPIEAFFTRGHTNFKVPDGISVMGYSGCPHWVITKYVLGLPKIGIYEQTIHTPFQLVTSATDNLLNSVIEVHPAVAIWLWCKDKIEKWDYKKNDKIFEAVLSVLSNRNILNDAVISKIKDIPYKKVLSDDYLDAYIAWYLGTQYINKATKNPVKLLGNINTGAWLVPDIDGLFDTFDFFVSKNQCE